VKAIEHSGPISECLRVIIHSLHAIARKVDMILNSDRLLRIVIHLYEFFTHGRLFKISFRLTGLWRFACCKRLACLRLRDASGFAGTGAAFLDGLVDLLNFGTFWHN
jgi:hypothetical protein